MSDIIEEGKEENNKMESKHLDSHVPERIFASIFKQILYETKWYRRVDLLMNRAADKIGLSGTHRSRYKTNISSHMASKKMTIKIFYQLLQTILNVRKVHLTVTVEFSNGKMKSFHRETSFEDTTKNKDTSEKTEENKEEGKVNENRK